jgi:hypothetical protein
VYALYDEDLQQGVSEEAVTVNPSKAKVGGEMATIKSRQKTLARVRAARKSLQAASRTVRGAKKRLGLVGKTQLSIWREPPQKVDPPIWNELPICKIDGGSGLLAGTRISKEITVSGKDFQKALALMEKWMANLLKTFNKAYPKKRSR